MSCPEKPTNFPQWSQLSQWSATGRPRDSATLRGMDMRTSDHQHDDARRVARQFPTGACALGAAIRDSGNSNSHAMSHGRSLDAPSSFANPSPGRLELVPIDPRGGQGARRNPNDRAPVREIAVATSNRRSPVHPPNGIDAAPSDAGDRDVHSIIHLVALGTAPLLTKPPPETASKNGGESGRAHRVLKHRTFILNNSSFTINGVHVW
jgi:hypothetical protein